MLELFAAYCKMFPWTMILLLLVLLLCVLFNSEMSDAAKLGDSIVLASDIGRTDKVQLPVELDSDETSSIDSFLSPNQRLYKNENRIEPNNKINGNGAVEAKNLMTDFNRNNLKQSTTAESTPSNNNIKTTQPIQKSSMEDADKSALPKLIEQTFQRNCSGEYTFK